MPTALHKLNLSNSRVSIGFSEADTSRTNAIHVPLLVPADDCLQLEANVLEVNGKGVQLKV